jgi:conjugative transfer signal peptidase TraF
MPVADGLARPAPRRRLIGHVGALAALGSALLSTILWPPRPRLLWNASASSPIGLYAIGSPDGVKVGDHVAAFAPAWARRLGSERRYIPLNVPLVKRVAAAGGDELCISGDTIFLNGSPKAKRMRADPLGRPMPVIEGCERLSGGQYFLFDPRQPNAFDGRYFGVIGADSVIGRARLIWHA